jgi:hypothetical protein
MPHIEESIEIIAPRADVFRFCHDLARRSAWDEQVANIELLTPRPLRRGTLLRFDAKLGNSVFSWDAEYVDFEHLSSSRLRAIDTAPTCPFAAGSELSWQFSFSGNSTRLNWVWDYKPRGFIANILDILGRRAATQRSIQRSLNNLKKLIESK